MLPNLIASADLIPPKRQYERTPSTAPNRTYCCSQKSWPRREFRYVAKHHQSSIAHILSQTISFTLIFAVFTSRRLIITSIPICSTPGNFLLSSPTTRSVLKGVKIQQCCV